MRCHGVFRQHIRKKPGNTYFFQNPSNKDPTSNNLYFRIDHFSHSLNYGGWMHALRRPYWGYVDILSAGLHQQKRLSLVGGRDQKRI